MYAAANFLSEKSRSVEPPNEESDDAEESSDEESDDDVPSKFDASKAATQSASESESESESEDEQDEAEDDEAASDISSGRDSRSPVTFSQHQAESAAAKIDRSVSPESASGSEDEAERDSSEDDETDEESENGDASEDEASDSEEAEVQVPESSPTLPKHKPAVKATVNHQVNSKNNTIERDTSTSTQGEIDQQLTSSIFEARRPSPASSPPQRAPPTLKVGASLQALNSKKPAFSSSARNSTTVKASQLQTLKEASGSEDESEEESDEASSDSDEETAKRLSSAFSRSPNKPKPKPTETDSDSSTDSDSDAESVDETIKIRNELAAQIKGVNVMDSQKSTVSIPSPKIVRGTQEVKPKPKNKYLSGYSFSQPGL